MLRVLVWGIWSSTKWFLNVHLPLVAFVAYMTTFIFQTHNEMYIRQSPSINFYSSYLFVFFIKNLCVQIVKSIYLLKISLYLQTPILHRLWVESVLACHYWESCNQRRMTVCISTLSENITILLKQNSCIFYNLLMFYALTSLYRFLTLIMSFFDLFLSI